MYHMFSFTPPPPLSDKVLYLQMLSCKTRGYAFTRALLGICSDELHVCGDPASVPLIQRILEVTGDVVQAIFSP